MPTNFTNSVAPDAAYLGRAWLESGGPVMCRQIYCFELAEVLQTSQCGS